MYLFLCTILLFLSNWFSLKCLTEDIKDGISRIFQSTTLSGFSGKVSQKELLASTWLPCLKLKQTVWIKFYIPSSKSTEDDELFNPKIKGFPAISFQGITGIHHLWTLLSEFLKFLMFPPGEVLRYKVSG